jgi:hypothetical protein
MKTIHVFPAAVFIASLLSAGVAQAQSAAAAPASGSASMPQDCAKTMAKHSHAVEKGTPVSASKSAGCAPVASASTKNDKTKHNHARDAK